MDDLSIPPIEIVAVDISDIIWQAYNDPAVSFEQFEAIVKSVWGDSDA